MYNNSNRFNRKNNNRFKKLKEKKRKAPQNYNNSMQRQRFITTIKNVTEKKKKKIIKSLIRFHSGNKITNYNRGGKREGGIQKESIEQVKT